jgi:hypothetical protein
MNALPFQNVVLFFEVIDFVSMAVAKENYRPEWKALFYLAFYL